MFKNQLKTKSGVSLAQVLVASAIVGVLALVVNSIITNSLKNIKNIDLNQNLVALESDIRVLLKNNQSCAYTFAGLEPYPASKVPISLSDIKAENGIDNKYSVGSLYYQGTLKIISINVGVISPAPTATNTLGSVKLSIEIEKQGSFLGPKRVMREFQIAVRLRGGLPVVDANKITACGSENLTAAANASNDPYFAVKKALGVEGFPSFVTCSGPSYHFVMSFSRVDKASFGNNVLYIYSPTQPNSWVSYDKTNGARTAGRADCPAIIPTDGSVLSTLPNGPI